MRRRKGSIAAVSLALALGAVAGCVESDPESAQTPSGAATVVNSAPQTDSEGNTVSAPSAGTSVGGGQPPPEGEMPGGGEAPPAGPSAPAGPGGAEGDPQAGLAVFMSAGCGSCHTFSAGGGNASVGPDLDQVLQGQTPEQIETSIVDPEAEVAEGFSPGIMPAIYGDQLSEEDLANLVAALAQ